MQRLVSVNSKRYVEKHGIEVTTEFLLLKLMEETGEFAEALGICEEQCRLDKRIDPAIARDNLQNELADVMTVVMAIANHLDIDLVAGLENKVFKKGRRSLEEASKE